MLGFALGTAGSGAAAFSLGACGLACPWGLSLWGLPADCPWGFGLWAPVDFSCIFGLSLGPWFGLFDWLLSLGPWLGLLD